MKIQTLSLISALCMLNFGTTSAMNVMNMQPNSLFGQAAKSSGHTTRIRRIKGDLSSITGCEKLVRQLNRIVKEWTEKDKQISAPPQNQQCSFPPPPPDANQDLNQNTEDTSFFKDPFSDEFEKAYENSWFS